MEQNTSKVTRSRKNSMKLKVKSKINAGKWTFKEHNLFVGALKTHDKDFKKVAEVVKTRTLIQIRSHAQKYFAKLKKEKQKKWKVPQKQRKAKAHFESVESMRDASECSKRTVRVKTESTHHEDLLLNNLPLTEVSCEIKKRCSKEEFSAVMAEQSSTTDDKSQVSLSHLGSAEETLVNVENQSGEIEMVEISSLEDANKSILYDDQPFPLYRPKPVRFNPSYEYPWNNLMCPPTSFMLLQGSLINNPYLNLQQYMLTKIMLSQPIKLSELVDLNPAINKDSDFTGESADRKKVKKF